MMQPTQPFIRSGVSRPMEPTANVDHKKDFAVWLQRPIRASVERAHGQVYVRALDFDVVGCGPDQDAAVADLFGLMRVYLRSFFDEGQAYEDAYRQVPDSRSGSARDRLERAFSDLRRRRKNLTLPAITPDAFRDAPRPI